MSFSFSAVGSQEEVVQQLESVKVDNDVGVYVKEALKRAFQEEAAHRSPDFDIKWFVDVSGHSGIGAPLTLTASVRPVWVRK